MSLVKEKEKYIKKLVGIYNRCNDKQLRIKVKGYYGDKGSFDCSRYNIMICTIEKSNSLVNNLVRQGGAYKLGCVVIDEMHALGDKDRGYHLEILIRLVLRLYNYSPLWSSIFFRCV